MKCLDLFSTSSRCFKQQKCEEGEDRISSLSDCLLLCILSFLSTEEVVRTSVLSKRWKYLWTSVSDIIVDFSPLDWSESDTRCQAEKLHFMKFVDNLLLRHSATNIERLHLSFDVPIEQSHVDAWIHAAIQHKVEELELELYSYGSYVFSSSLFNFETLTVLKLENCDLNIPLARCFRNLTILHLSYVTFLNDHQSTQCLISDSPFLHDLVMSNCTWNNSTTFVVFIPSLLRFKMIFDDVRNCVKIYAPNLEVLKLWGGFLWDHDILLCNSVSLVKASLCFSMWGLPCESHANRSKKLFKSIQTVESLKIHDCILRECRSIETVHLVDHLPTSNMVYLEVLYDECFDDGICLIEILQRSPKLESLFIDACLGRMEFSVSDEWLEYSAPPSFTTPALKEITLDSFQGNAAEMHLLEILLKSASSLETIDLRPFSNLLDDPEKFKKVENKLQTLPRASPSCVIRVYVKFLNDYLLY